MDVTARTNAATRIVKGVILVIYSYILVGKLFCKGKGGGVAGAESLCIW